MAVMMFISYVGVELQMTANNICENERERPCNDFYNQLIQDSIKLLKRNQPAFCFYDYQIETIKRLATKKKMEIEIIKTECGYMVVRKEIK